MTDDTFKATSTTTTDLVSSVVAIRHLDVRLHFDPVEVLVEPVQKEREQLLAVLLLVPEQIN